MKSFGRDLSGNRADEYCGEYGGARGHHRFLPCRVQLSRFEVTPAVSVVQRSKEIGILRAMGTTRGKILRIFLLQGTLLGFVGSLFGSAMGAGALVYRHSLARQADGTELFPLVFERQLFVETIILATLTGLLAATAPALSAANLDPVVAIRG
jgi:lipoprotein-releasing system permease protein